MTTWIRSAGGGPWHRVSDLEYADAMSRGYLSLYCGGILRTDVGWEDAVEEVPPDDQDPPCRERADREAFWRERLREAGAVELTAVTRALVREAAPGLTQVNVLPRIGPNRLWVMELRASNLRPVLAGAGPTPAAAIADLLASAELLAAEARNASSAVM